MDAKHSLVRNWVMKARRDLLSAKKLARAEKNPILIRRSITASN